MKTTSTPYLSVLISTYNKPEYLEMCIESYLRQSYDNFELVITDDGSDNRTAQLIHQFQNKTSIPIKHIWQEDQGFRLARVRNLGIVAAQGEYLLFTDQDCIADKDLLKEHIENAKNGQVIQGNRRLFSSKQTNKILNLSIEEIFELNLKKLSKRHHLEYFFVFRLFRHFGALVDCNLSGFKKDFLSVNMYDESFSFWGGQDLDLGFRMKTKGYNLAFFKNRSFVYHLYHQSSRNLLNKYYRRLYKKIIKHNLRFPR